MCECGHWVKPSLKIYIMSKLDYKKYKGYFECSMCGIENKETKRTSWVFAISNIGINTLVMTEFFDSFQAPLQKIIIYLIVFSILYIPLEIVHYFYSEYD